MNQIDIAQLVPQQPADRVADATRQQRPSDNDRLVEMAHEFEALLVYQMLRQMRQAMTLDDEGQGFGAETMNETVDLELSRQLSRQGGGIGLAEIIVRQLTPGSPLPTTERPVGIVPRVTAAPVAPEPAATDVEVGPPAVEPTGPPSSGILPLDGATTSPYGWRRDPFGGNHQFHGGVDIRAAYGSEVPAVASGRITFAGAQGGYGNTVVVEHEPGVLSRYAHLSAVLVEPGERVSEGQVIGRVGGSGRATGPHLHFEVVANGDRIDPLGPEGKAALLKNVGQMTITSDD